MENNYFVDLNSVNVNDKVEKKNGLNYLSWSYSWAELKKKYPDSTYTIYENAQGWNYHTDGKTCWVKTGVIVNGIEHIEYLPVMDFKNKSIPADSVTSFDVNKAIQRSLTKAVARHGLGLYIYAGEDLPEEEAKDVPKQETKDKPKQETNDISEKITDTQYDLISDLFDDTSLNAMLKYFGVNDIAELTKAQASKAITQRQKTLEERKKGEAKNE